MQARKQVAISECPAPDVQINRFPVLRGSQEGSSKLIARAIAASEASDRAAEQTATQVVESIPFNDKKQLEHVDPRLQHTTAQIVTVGDSSVHHSANGDEFNEFMEYNDAL